MRMESRLVEEVCGSVGLSRGSVYSETFEPQTATLLSTAPSAALYSKSYPSIRLTESSS